MATTVNLIPTNEVSNRLQIASTTTWKLCPETPDNGTAVATSIASTSTNTTNWFQVTPGATNSTGQASLPTTPNGKGWICELDYTSAGGTGLQNSTQNIKLDLTAGTGCTFTVDVMCWVLTLPSSRPATSITSQSQIGSTVSVTGVTSSTTNPVTFALAPGAAFALGANQYLYYEVWVKQTVSGTTHTLAVGANVGKNGEGWPASLDDSGTLINGTTNVAETFQWNNKVGFYRNKFGMVRAVVDTANGIRMASSNIVPNTATANAAALEFQITAGGSVQNTDFVTTAGAKTEAINNPICQSIQIASGASGGYSSSNYVSQLTTWFGVPSAVFTQYWGSATSVSFTNMAARYPNAANGTAGAGVNTSNGATNTNFAQSTAGAGVNGWGYSTGAASTAGICMVPDRHRASNQLFTFIDAGTNTGTSTLNQLSDNTANATATSWGGRMAVYVDATANIGTTAKDKYLNNYNKNLNGPPTISNSRLSINTGTVKSDSDSGQSSILSGFDYETGAFRITASSNNVLASLQSLTSYALPYRCFIIEGYTATTAPVVATNGTGFGATFTALDSGVTSNAGTLYKGTNYASFVDTVGQIAYVAIFGDQAANTTTYYQIVNSMSTAWTKTVTDTITPTDTETNMAGKGFTETLTGTDAIIKFPQYMCPAGSCTITASDVANKSFTKSPFAETITPTATQTTMAGLVKTDTITPTSAQTTKPGKVLSDTLTPSDIKFFSMVKGAFAETLTGTDAAIKSFVKGIVSDTITLTDATLKGPGKVLADTLTPSSALAGFTTIKAVLETLTGTDTATKAVSKPLADTVTPTAAQTTMAGKKLTDTVTPSDVANKSVSKGAFAESLTYSDTMIKVAGKNLADTLTATAALGPFAVIKGLAETLTGTDTKAMAFTKAALTEIINPVDSAHFIAFVKGAFSETITPSDTTTKSVAKGAFAETITPDDGNPVFSFLKLLLDSITPSDTSRPVIAFTKLLTASMTVTSSVATSFSGSYTINLNETITATAAIIKSFVLAALTETVTPSDAVTKKPMRTLLETITPSDSLTAALTHNFSKILTETLTATDTKLLTFIKVLAEAITPTDISINGLVHAYFKTLTETLTLTDTVALVRTVAQFLTELANVRNLATRDFTEGAEILLFVDQQVSEISNILKLATSAIIEKSNVSGLTSQTFTEKANVYTLLAQTLTEKANIFQILYATLKETSGVLNTLAVTLTEKSNASQAIADTLTELANVAQLAGKSLTEKANAVQHMAQTLTEQANVAGISSLLITTNNNVLGLLNRDFTTKMNAMQIVFQTLTEQANAAQLATKNLTEQANTLTLAMLSKTSFASILGLAGQSTTTQTNFFQHATQNLSEIGGVYAIVAQTLTETVNMAAATAKTVTELANVNGLVGKSFIEQANSRQVVPQHVTTLTDFLLLVHQDIHTPSNILGLVGRSNTTLANFIAHVGTNLTDPSNILAVIHRDLTTKQNVLSLATKTLTEMAGSEGTTGVQFSTYMTISRPAACTLTSVASLQNPELGRLFNISEIGETLAIKEQGDTYVISETAYYRITPIEIKE